MIPVTRGPEPTELTSVRATKLPVAITEYNAAGATSVALKSLLDGYQCAKPTLFTRQHKKCAYCERKPGLDGQPTEHYRPKKERHQLDAAGQKRVDAERYWWLCWTWENLLFGCHTCNSAARKGSWFQLKLGTAPLPSPPRPASLPLPAACLDLSAESPLLLDPASAGFNPTAHMRWSPVDRTLHPGRWTWTLTSLSDEGRYTIRVFRLCEQADDIDARFQKVVWRRFKSEVMGRSHAQAAAAWTELCRELLTPDSPFVLATWWQLSTLRSWPHVAALSLPPPAPLR